MIIVQTEKLKEGMRLYSNVDSTTWCDYVTLMPKGSVLTADKIALIREKGIKSVKIADSSDKDEEIYALPEELEKKEHIKNALTDLDEIFDSNDEIKELSQAAVEKVDRIAADIINDISKDKSFLGNQMIALQNYDDYTYKHCLRVAMMAASVCDELEFPSEKTRDTVTAGLLHDIGKSNIDHEIIIKPGKLTNEEFDEIKKHPLIGYNILKQSGEYNENILSGVLFHQEKYDGSGYPTGLRGAKIPLIARILTICDVFDALTSNRPYRTPWSVAETEEYIFGSCGTHFDYNVTLAFLQAFNPYPLGTLVKLSDGRYGAVTAHNENVLRPTVTTRGENGGEILDLTNDFSLLTVSIEGIYNGEIE